MYISELAWYQRQEQKKASIKKGLRCICWMLLIIMLAILLFCFPWSKLFFWQDSEEVAKITINEDDNLSQNNEWSNVTENDTNSEEVMIEQEDVVVQRNAPLIILDPGHGGMDEGCSNGDAEEKEINLRLALSLKVRLEELGFIVMLTRTDDVEKSLVDRAGFAREQKGDLLISIHQNACEYVSATGIETWYDESMGAESKRLAKLVQQYSVLYTGAKDRGIVTTDSLYVIRESKMPSCLIETGFLSNEEEAALLQDEEYCEKLVQGLTDAVWFYFYPKKMYLTFDDGPSKENTEKILDVLKEKNIKATFFVVGENAIKYPDIIKRISEEGHVIGVHCYNHSYDKLYADVNSYIADFEKARKLIFEMTGEKVWCYRFPGGSINKYNRNIYQEIIKEMSDAGYVYYDWNACFEDAVPKPNQEAIIKSAVESTLQRKKIVMLAHDTVDETAMCLSNILERLPEYEFLPLSKEVEPIRFK